jgi:hypothetical protein
MQLPSSANPVTEEPEIVKYLFELFAIVKLLP